MPCGGKPGGGAGDQAISIDRGFDYQPVVDVEPPDVVHHDVVNLNEVIREVGRLVAH